MPKPQNKQNKLHIPIYMLISNRKVNSRLKQMFSEAFLSKK